MADVLRVQVGRVGPRLLDGERRRIKATPFEEPARVEVDAYRVDCDTPYVVLITPKGEEVYLEDSVATGLLQRIARALAILPTSK